MKIDYNIYVSDKKAQNPVYDTRWMVTPENQLDTENAVVTEWWYGRGTQELSTDWIQSMVKGISENITLDMGDDEILATLNSLPTTDNDTIVGMQQTPYKNMGKIISLGDYINVLAGNIPLVHIFRLKGNLITQFEVPPETDEDTSNWQLLGNGVGFSWSFGCTIPHEYDGKKATVNANSSIMTGISKDFSKLKLIVAHNNFEGGVFDEYYVAEPFDNTDFWSFTNNSLKTRANGDGIAELLTITSDKRSLFSATVNGQKWRITRISESIIPSFWQEKTMKNPSKHGAGEGLNGVWYDTEVQWKDKVFSKQYSGMYEITHDYIGASSKDAEGVLKEFLTKYLNGELMLEDSTYTGDFCYYFSTFFELFNKYNRNYVDGKMTQTTSDTINVHIVSEGDKPSTDADDYYPPPVDDDTPPDEQDVLDTGIGILVTTYSSGKQSLSQIGRFIWSDGYDPKAKNATPLENVLSLKRFPFAIQGGTSANVIIGGVDTQVTSSRHASSLKNIGECSIMVERRFNNFFDFEPYTSCTLYIPFIGFVDVAPSEIMNKEITLKFYVDIQSGNLKVKMLNHKNLINSYDGVCAIDVPLTATNFQERATAYLKNYINTTERMGSSAISLGSKSATSQAGGVLGIASAAADAYVNEVANKIHYTTKGSLDSATALSLPMTPYFTIEYPRYMIPAGFARQVGFRCEKTMYLSQVHGYTVVNNVQLDGLKCTDAEAKEIERLLKEGVYL